MVQGHYRVDNGHAQAVGFFAAQAGAPRFGKPVEELGLQLRGNAYARVGHRDEGLRPPASHRNADALTIGRKLDSSGNRLIADLLKLDDVEAHVKWLLRRRVVKMQVRVPLQALVFCQ